MQKSRSPLDGMRGLQNPELGHSARHTANADNGGFVHCPCDSTINGIEWWSKSGSQESCLTCKCKCTAHGMHRHCRGAAQHTERTAGSRVGAREATHVGPQTHGPGMHIHQALSTLTRPLGPRRACRAHSAGVARGPRLRPLNRSGKLSCWNVPWVTLNATHPTYSTPIWAKNIQ